MAKACSSPELPPDILFSNILPRLPAKSLLRFKCVSKQWHSFLKTPLFDKLHLYHHQNHHKLLVFSTRTPFVFHTIDCEAPEDGLSATRPLPFKVSSRYYMKVLASFGGLVCVGIIKHSFCSTTKYSDLILWNPFTGDFKTLSKPHKSHKECYSEHGTFGLYYSSCDDDYKLLRVTCNSDAYIYSLKSDCWKKIDKTSIEYLKQRRMLDPWCSSTVLNDKIYTLNNNGLDDPILMFDTKTEKFTEISTPSFNENQNIFRAHLMVLRACIHLYVIYCVYGAKKSYFLELWRMDGDGDWTKVDTYGIHLSNIIDQPLHLMRNGELLAYVNVGKGYVCKLVLTNPIDIKKLLWSYTPDPDHWFYIPDGGKYIETLVSPNRSIDEVRQPLCFRLC